MKKNSITLYCSIKSSFLLKEKNIYKKCMRASNHFKEINTCIEE